MVDGAYAASAPMLFYSQGESACRVSLQPVGADGERLRDGEEGEEGKKGGERRRKVTKQGWSDR